jgi:NADPH2:quinone reductase
MRAWRITDYGTAPRAAEVPVPKPPARSKRVRVTAVPITPLDILTASGRSYFGQPPLPYTPGVQGVGVVEDEPDRRVWFTTDAGMQPGDGSLAESAAVPQDRMWTITEEVPDAVVAALGLSAVAAHGSLHRGRFAPGDRVLVLGAGGVVGQVAVQLAKAWGASRVAAACRGKWSRQRARDLGADVAVDSSSSDAAELRKVFEQALPDGVDLVIDSVCGPPAEAAMQIMAPGGRLVNLGSSGSPSARFDSALVRSRMLELLGYTNLALPWPEQTRAMAQVLALAAVGRVRLDPEMYTSDDAALAWSRQAAGTARSRVVVTFDPAR